MSTRVERTNLKVTVSEPVPRQTEKKNFSSMLMDGVEKTARIAAGALGATAPFSPTGAMLSVAASGIGEAAGAGETLAGGSGGSGGGPQDLLDATRQMQETNMEFNVQYLGLQEKLQQESREFQLLSNVMKVKHDAAKNAIGNIH